jgi:hypothetical protein
LPRSIPYEPGTEEALAWISGYAEGKEKPFKPLKD